ncbi:hypothetical protein EV669_105123 [Gulbenkiania mobilis]|uniref:Uncharacterized protein n=2 Tax=Gulbenkiania mobilis TaxID=397457 RepID=A0ABY2CWK2_GULMO|nr:hypothetical protein EV669_105123 [Gulbenkiania mobilis]
MPSEVFSAHYATAPEYGTEGQPDEATEFFAATIRWLEASGYIRIGTDRGFVFMDTVLTPKGLEALCVTPRSLQGEAPLGERLSEALKSGSKSLLAETIKAVLAAGASRWFGG